MCLSKVRKRLLTAIAALFVALTLTSTVYSQSEVGIIPRKGAKQTNSNRNP